MRSIRQCYNNLGRVTWVLLVSVIFFTGMMLFLSVQRYRAYNAHMLDLGNMAQSVWSATQGKPLTFSYNGRSVSRLALHVELVYFLFAPLYALFPSPITLLTIQALLYGAGAFPLFALARRRTGDTVVAWLIVLIYLLYLPAQTAVLFDFHGETLAMLILLLALEAMDREAWRAYTIWIGLALSCKFYVSLPVALLGAWLWLTDKRRAGRWTLLGAVAWGGLAFFVIRPLFTSSDVALKQMSPLGYFLFYFGELWTLVGQEIIARGLISFVIFAPLLWVGFWAFDWLLLSLLTALPVLMSTGPGPSYHYRYHHYALMVPFALMTFVYGLGRLRRGTRRARLGRLELWPIILGGSLLTTLFLSAWFVDTPLSPTFWQEAPQRGWGEWAYGRTGRDDVKDRWVAEVIPPRAPLAASPFLAPHVANRSELYLMAYSDAQHDVEFDPLVSGNYVLLDGLFDYVEVFGDGTFAGGVGYERPFIAQTLSSPAFDLTAARDGLLLVERSAPETEALHQDVRVEIASSSIDSLELHAQFADLIGLVDFSVEPMPQSRRFVLEYVWRAVGPIDERAALFAVSFPKGVSHTRFVHLPTLAIYPTTDWEEDEIIRERFEIEFPSEVAPGTYPIWTGWFQLEERTAHATDARSRVGQLRFVGVLKVR